MKNKKKTVSPHLLAQQDTVTKIPPKEDCGPHLVASVEHQPGKRIVLGRRTPKSRSALKIDKIGQLLRFLSRCGRRRRDFYRLDGTAEYPDGFAAVGQGVVEGNVEEEFRHLEAARDLVGAAGDEFGYGHSGRCER